MTLNDDDKRLLEELRQQHGVSAEKVVKLLDTVRAYELKDRRTIQQEIRRLYDQATESAKLSRQLLDQAKSRVEQLIEEVVRA